MSRNSNRFKGLTGTLPRLPLAALVVAVLGVSAIACHRDRDDANDDDTSGGEERIPRETCLGNGGEESGVDVDGDGDADLHEVRRSGVLVCTAMDMNFDGRIDLTRFYDADGTTTRLEMHDFDFDGKLDLVAIFENGERVRQELDTDFDDRPDLFMWCSGGRATRVERSRLRRGRVDTWERYDLGLLHEASYDEDGDGNPERFEYYRDGRLVGEAQDRNGDGDISDEERSVIEDEFAGRPQQMLCDRNAVDAAARAEQSSAEHPDDEAAPPRTPSTSTASTDAGVPLDAAGLAPWELPRDAGVRDARSDR